VVKKISDYLEKPMDNREIVKSGAVLGEVILIEDAHFRKGIEGQYVSIYFHFADDPDKTAYCWNTSSSVIMDQIRILKDKGAFDDDEPVTAKVIKRRNEKGLKYYVLVDPDEEE